MDGGKQMSKYKWPASEIDEKTMRILFEMKQRTGKSISLLIKEAIVKTYSNHDSNVKSNHP